VAFPEIAQCLVCEIIRPEEGGKLSILGFFGMAPNVEIQIQNLDVPLVGLAFVFLGSAFEYDPSGPPQFISILLKSPAGSTVVETPPTPLNVPTLRGNRTMIASGFAGVRLPEVGKYHVLLRSNGETKYETTFDVIHPLSPRPN
jgi:hypothetical protein